MAIFPRTALAWTVRGSEEINQDSLRFFRVLEPKIDLVVIGLETKERSSIDAVFKAARMAKLNVEILPVEHACSTFNFLNAEGRCIAGALIPPLHLSPTEDDMLQSKLHYQNLYQAELK
ncbi:hypothetical protein O0L34_g12084 [Tuta absoluta]|nr:hypothetical protein O0L34_g12084 [Tuta absoluta]